MREDDGMPTLPEELWGSGDICQAFGVSAVTFKRWRDSGQFPEPYQTVNRGRNPVWDAQTVRGWYEARKRKPATAEE